MKRTSPAIAQGTSRVRKPQYLYVMDYCSVRMCKVGISANPLIRLGEARTFWPHMEYAAVYELPDAYAAEQALLELHSAHRVARSEVLLLPARRVVRSANRLADSFGASLLPEYRRSVWERAVERFAALFRALY